MIKRSCTLLLLLASFGIGHATSQVKSTVPPSAAAPTFAVATFRLSGSPDSPPILRPTRDGYRATSVTLRMLIADAYSDDHIYRIDGGPAWADLDRYDFNAKLDESAAVATNADINDEHVRSLDLALRALLVERCHLAAHTQSGGIPAYALTLTKGSPKFKAGNSPDPDLPNGILRLMHGQLLAQGVSIARLAGILESQLGRPVIDQTGLPGTYNFTLRWESEDTPDPVSNAPSQQPPAVDDPRSLIPSALQQQLGLKLVPSRAPVNILVIDHLERPSAN